MIYKKTKIIIIIMNHSDKVLAQHEIYIRGKEEAIEIE